VREFLQRHDDEDDYDDPLGAPMLWPDGKHVAANGLGRIFVWDLESGECVRVLPTKAICRGGDPYFRLDADPVLERVLEGDGVREFALWDAKEWKRIQRFLGHAEETRAASFVAEDRIISVSCDSTAKLWDAWSGECLREIDTLPLYALAVHPDGKRVAVAGGQGHVYVLDARSLTEQAHFKLTQATAKHAPLDEARKKAIGIVWNRPSATIRAIAWHPDGEHLLCGSWDFVPKMLEVKSGRVVRSWHGHAHWVDAVAVDAAGRGLITGSSDGTLRIWSLERTECLAVIDTADSSVGGILVHEGYVYATCGRRLLCFAFAH